MKKVALYLVPKAANTSVKSAIINSRYDYELFWTHQFDPTNYSCFAFVRNPFDRLVSCYIHKIINQGRFESRTPLEDYGMYKNMPFNKFVHTVCDIPDEVADRHFRSQSSLLPESVTIFKTEFSKQDWYFFRCLKGLTLRPLEHRRKTKHKPYTEFYNLDLKEKVAERYKEDLRRFHYSYGSGTCFI